MIFAQKTIEDFLYTPGKFFEIPEFQRPYSWQANNIREFLSDLEDCIDKSKNHYFGTVVFVRETDNIDSSAIIDGQQRVTTALLMILAIYHLVGENSDLSTLSGDDIKEKYLLNRNQGNRIKLRTVTTDNTVLQRIFDVIGDEAKLTQDEKLSKLFQAYSEFKHYFSKKTELHKYITALSHFEIVTIALDSRDDNPQRVFESINSTGKPLTDGDKIRNFALMLNNDSLRQHVYEKYWQKIEQSLTDVKNDYITDFFRSYVISNRQSVIKLDSVYPEFKKLFSNRISENQTIEEVDAFYSDILNMLEYYMLCKFEKDPNQKYPEVVKNVVFKMRYIQTEIYIPFAMTVLRHFNAGKISESELIEVFISIEVYFARRIVCNIPTTSVDRFLASLHKDIHENMAENSGATYVDILKYILLNRSGPTRIPADDDIELAVKNNNTYNQRNAHVNFILASVDDTSKESSTLRDIASGNKKLSIEHIMPQKLTLEWEKEIDPENKGVEYIHEVHGQYLHKLANLTLTGYNSEYSNKPYEVKKSMPDGFNDSPLKINQQTIAHVKHWDEKALLNRQDWWCKSLKTVWELPSTSFKPFKQDTSTELLKQEDLKGFGIRSVTIFGDEMSVTTWAEALDTLAEKLFEKFPNFIEIISDDAYLSSWISTDSSKFFNSAEILDTGWFIATGNDTNSKLKCIKALANKFKLANSDLLAEIVPPKSS